jgi:hypothetical protein
VKMCAGQISISAHASSLLLEHRETEGGRKNGMMLSACLKRCLEKRPAVVRIIPRLSFMIAIVLIGRLSMPRASGVIIFEELRCLTSELKASS